MNPARNQEEVIDYVLQKNAARLTAGLGSMDQETPLEALMRAEESAGEGEEWAIRTEAWHTLLEFFFSEGPEPLAVIRQIYGIVKALKPELIGDMSCEDIALLCGDGGRATVSARIKRIYNNLLTKNGSRAKAPFQKNPEALRSFSRAQRGNKNRTKNQRKRGGSK